MAAKQFKANHLLFVLWNFILISSIVAVEDDTCAFDHGPGTISSCPGQFSFMVTSFIVNILLMAL